MNGDAILNLTEKFQSLFKKYWLKGQESVRCQCAQVHRLQGQLSLVAVCPGQFQHLLHQGPHLPGHGEDIGGKLRLTVPVIFPALQQLGVSHDDGQGGLQLVGSVRNKLTLLLPGPFHRLYRPGGQLEADGKKGEKAEHTDEDTVLGQIVQGGLLTGGICEDHTLSKGAVCPQKTQVILLQFPEGALRPVHLSHQFLQKGLVKGLSGGERVIPHTGGFQRAIPLLLHHKEGQTDLLRPLVRTGKGSKGLTGRQHSHRNGAHHGKALLLQTAPCKKIEHPKNGTQHDGDDHHNDCDKLDPQALQHPPSTSRR